MTTITLLKATTKKRKTELVTQMARYTYSEKRPLIIVTQSDRAARFVDELLWGFSKTAFLPHRVGNTPTDALIAITTAQENVNQAKVALNLSPEPLEMGKTFEELYQLWDGASDLANRYRALGFEQIREVE